MGAVPVVTSVSVVGGPVAAQTAEYVPAVVARIVVGNPVIMMARTIAEAYNSTTTGTGPSEREKSTVIIPVAVVPEAGVSHPGVMSAHAVRGGVGGVDVVVDVNVVDAAARGPGGALVAPAGS